MIRVLIIDDEELARKRLRRLLSAHSDLQIMDEAECGFTGSAAIRKHQPDLVLLDIDMPGLDGFDLLQLDFVRKPVVIFSTAYPDYALRAYDADAVDYLLKPYDQRRFDHAIAKARLAIREWHLLPGVNKYLAVLEIVEKGVQHQLALDRVTHIEAYGNYVKLHALAGFLVHRLTMGKLEAQLDPRQFIRVHRSYIVNVAFIASIRYLSKGEYEILLENGTRLTSGRKYKSHILSHTKVTI